MSLSRKHILLASIIGNALEFYDFTLFGVFTTLIAARYFPGSDSTASLLFSLTFFALGFFARPVGAILFGHIGDKMGRKKALSLSVFLMGLPTFIIGITPTYAEIGIWGSVTIFFCRLLQGIFTGGEYNGAAIFSIEHLGKNRPGFIGGLITASCVIGACAATFFGALVQLKGMPEWAWRLPFILGIAISLIGYFIRKKIAETPEFLAFQEEKDPKKAPLVRTLLRNFQSSLTTFILGGFNGAFSYTLFGFLNIYLSRYCDMPASLATGSNLLGLFAFMFGSPVMGHYLDVLGAKLYLQRALLAIFFLLVPIFLLLSSKLLLLILLGQLGLGICTAGVAGCSHGIMQKLFPVSDRYRGISFNFSLGMGLFGGLTPLFYVHMIEREGADLLLPAFFLMTLTTLAALNLLKNPIIAASEDEKTLRDFETSSRP